MRLISWNVNARRSHAPAQVAALVSRAPDIVALQEITPTTVGTLTRAFENAGFTSVVYSFALAPPAFVPAGPRRYGLLIASRHPLIAEAPGRFDVPWPERVLSVTIPTDRGPLELHTTHVPPGSSNGWVKVGHLDGLYHGLAMNFGGPRILCGDFNTPQHEGPDGEIVTWAQRRQRDGAWAVARRFRGGAGNEWDASERRILSGLAQWDLPDAFRRLHGYAAVDASWWLRRGERLIGRRFDHVFASSSLAVRRCAYLHDFRVVGLSDHSPIELDWE